MKIWPLLVAGLYGAILFTLFGPLLWIAFPPKTFSFDEIQELLSSLWVWIPLTTLVLAQIALLRVPVAIAYRRPVRRMPVFITVGAAAFMMGLLLFGAILSIYEFSTRLEGLDNPMWLTGIVALASWLGWAMYFYNSTKNVAPIRAVKRLQRFMWSGSVLELLIAIPTHIVARNRSYCCAGMLTFIGLVCGISVMLFAFGPALYFLFAERWKRLHQLEAEI